MSAKESAKSTREKAAAARAEAEAEQKRRDRTVRIIGGLAVLAVIGAIFGAVIWMIPYRSLRTRNEIPPRFLTSCTHPSTTTSFS